MTSSLRVLLADDSEDIRHLLMAAFRRDGRFEVAGAAADADSAVAHAAELRPDLIVLDLGMPGRGGLEAIPRLREASPDSRIVVLSGFPGDRLEAVTRAEGAVGYVEKSLSAKQMVFDVLAVAGVLDAISGALSSSVKLDQDLASGRAARRFMAETLTQWSCGDLLDTVSLLVTELVTNAVVHAGSEAEVSVVLTAAALRVEVSDRGEGTVAPRDAKVFDTSGRGMALVDAMSSRWGHEPRTGGGNVVWFELERSAFQPSP